MAEQGGIDRLSVRRRPGCLPVMYQSWRKLLFMHWKLPPELIRPHVPDRLQIDTCEGCAWIGVTPFLVRNLRPVFLPPVPWLSDFNEVNVRTYVHYEGVPGVWFFSLDADSVLAVAGASTAYRLPYRHARIRFREEKDQIFYSSRRIVSPEQPARLEVSWRKGELLGEAAPDSLEFFLVERYCLYAVSGSGLYRARVHHPPWQLQAAELTGLNSTMLEAQGLPKPAGEPLLHYSEHQDTAVWPLQKVG
jgi:uncharacterized protein